MKLHVTQAAIDCLTKEWDFEAGESVRVYVRYQSGGPSPLVLGIQKEKPGREPVALRQEAGGISFFMEERDAWFLEGRDLTIDANGSDLLFVTNESR